jgi:hypothetical protein
MTITLKGPHGETVGTPEAKKIIGLLALHRSPRGEMWVITHIPTGFAAGTYHLYVVGLAALRALAALKGWEYVTGPKAPVEAPDLWPAAGEIVQTYRSITSVRALETLHAERA